MRKYSLININARDLKKKTDNRLVNREFIRPLFQKQTIIRISIWNYILLLLLLLLLLSIYYSITCRTTIIRNFKQRTR